MYVKLKDLFSLIFAFYCIELTKRTLKTINNLPSNFDYNQLLTPNY